MLSQNPLISIIIPVFNAGRYLDASISCCLLQSYGNIEILVIDDGSTDNSVKIINLYADRGVKILYQKNRGASAARNLGIQHAKGEYLQFLDADDFLSPDKIEKQVDALRCTTDKLGVCSTIHFNEKEDPFALEPSTYEEKFIYTTDDVVDFTIRLWGGYNFEASMIQTNAWLVPRSLIIRHGNWKEYLSLDDDGEFFGRLLLNSKGIIKTGGKNYYRKYLNSSSLSAKKSHSAMKSALDSILLKKEHLFSKSDSVNAKMAIFKQLKELEVRCYPFYMDLQRIVEKELNELPKFEYKVGLGGRFVNNVADIFGWKAARRIQSIIRS